MSKSTIRYGSWYSIYVCSSCLAQMSDNTKMYSHGVCPSCGYKNQTSPTMCSTQTIVIRKVKYHKWYQLFNRKTVYESTGIYSAYSVKALIEQMSKHKES